MPRVEKSNRTSVLVSSDSYDLNNNFKSFAGGHTYDMSNDIVVWGDFCPPSEAEISAYPIKTGADRFSLVGTDKSDTAPANTHGFYVPAGALPFSGVENLTSFCGKKCYYFISNIRRDVGGSGSGYKYFGSKILSLTSHSDLNFISGGNDTGFSISFWIYPRTLTGEETAGASINLGGQDPSGNPIPTFFEKKDEYSLKINTAGNLRFSINTNASNFTYVESEPNLFSAGQWSNITVTYDGSESNSGMKIYHNGEDVTSSQGSTGTYSGMTATSNDLTVAGGDGPETCLPTGLPAKGFGIHLVEFVVWKSGLNPQSVRAVYNATLTCAASETSRASGYTSLTPRVRLRNLDSATGSYPTVMRTGDKDFSGKNKIQFDDTRSLIFGERIVDEFSDVRENESFSKRINSNKWVFTPGLEIRKETLRGFNGDTFEDGVLVFKGLGERSLQTKSKVRNAIISYELVQGPHNETSSFQKIGLNLKAGNLNEHLKVQFSKDGSSWTDIRQHTPTSNLSIFYSPTGEVLTTNSEEDIKNQRRRREYIHFSDIEAGSDEYYIRFVQESTEGKNKAVWGIGRIEIESINQPIRYPLLLNHENGAGKSAADQSIALPHTRSDLTGIGRTLPGVSDMMIHFTPGENISPFYENDAVESLDSANLFHAIGSPPEKGVVGFESKLADKTKIVINLDVDLSSAAKKQVTIGHTSNSSTSDPANQAPNDLDTSTTLFNPFTSKVLGTTYQYNHQLMCFYDNKNKGWTTRGFPPTISSTHTVERFVEDFAHLAFGPTDIIASRSAGSVIATTEIDEQYGKDVLSNYVRPVKTFGFPFSKKYEFDSDRTVKMSDYINKPFLLEKIVVDFDANFEFAPNNSNAEHSYGLHQSWNSSISGGKPSLRLSTGNHRVIIPSFFIVNQFNDAYNVKYDLRVEYSDFKNYTINYNSDNRSREMVSYGQMCLFLSSSQGYDIDLERALEEGLGRDLNIDVIARTGQSTEGSPAGDINSFNVNPITGSFKLEFPCRTSPKTGFNQRVLIGSASAGSPGTNLKIGMMMSDQSGGRNYEGMERGSRGLINNHPGQKVGRQYKTFSTVNTKLPLAVSSVADDYIDQYSPYILFPGDELIFGWQYPINSSYAQFTNGSGDTGMKNLMTIVGNSKVYLYGSLMSDRKEHHEYSNQPLNSDAIHEIIGAEKPIDKFQISTRGELSGSYVDQWIYIKEQFDPSSASDEFFIYSDASEHRSQRINSKVLSIGSGKQNDYSIFGFATSDPDLIPTASAVQSILGEENQVQRFINLWDNKRVYFDSLFLSGAFAGKKSTYGTLQTYYGPDLKKYIGLPSGKSWGSLTREFIDGAGYPLLHKKMRPKYYFNYRHFGHSFDFFEQGKDSKFFKSAYEPTLISVEEEPQKEVIANLTRPPVVVKFATSSLVEDSRIKVYSETTPGELYTGDLVAPYNLSTYSTSSDPFKDPSQTEPQLLKLFNLL